MARIRREPVLCAGRMHWYEPSVAVAPGLGRFLDEYGLAVGIAIGAVIGLIFGNVAIGVVAGIPLGLAS